jgi:oxaloacetate decarboxylase beta subunit
MHAMGPNVAGVIGSAVAAGIFLSLFGGPDLASHAVIETGVQVVADSLGK